MRLEHILDSFTKAVVDYMSTPKPEPVVVPLRPHPPVAPPEPSTEQPTTIVEVNTEPPPAPASAPKKAKKKSLIQGERTMAESILELLKGRPIEGLGAQQMFEMLTQMGIQPASIASVAATLAALTKRGQVTRVKLGRYVRSDGGY